MGKMRGSTVSSSDMKGFFRQRKSNVAPSKSKPPRTKPSPAAAAQTLSHSSPDGLSEDWDKREEMLRQFDMDMTYGPCLGLSRLERWERAHALGLDPPKDVEGFLKGGGKVALECLWDGRI